jgi:putative transposase
MPRRTRDKRAGVIFHAMNRAAKRTVLFEDGRDYTAFEALIRQGLTRDHIALFSYCIMPNHWHFVISANAEGALSRFMHRLETTHARRWQDSRGLSGLGAVYQGRFKAIPLLNDDHFLWVCRYVERNPLRAGLVDDAANWQWSSLGRARNRSITLTEWPLARPSDWADHVNTPKTDAERERFDRPINPAMLFGDEDWQDEVRELLQVTPRRPRGRPRKEATSVLFK